MRGWAVCGLVGMGPYWIKEEEMGLLGNTCYGSPGVRGVGELGSGLNKTGRGKNGLLAMDWS